MRPMKMFNTTFVLRFTLSILTNEVSFDDITIIGKKLYYLFRSKVLVNKMSYFLTKLNSMSKNFCIERGRNSKIFLRKNRVIFVCRNYIIVIIIIIIFVILGKTGIDYM